MTELHLSPLGKTWLIDVDGVLVRHNGHHAGGDEILPGVRRFFDRLGIEDRVLLLTARPEADRSATLAALAALGLRWHGAIFGLPHGERVCINDRKPSGLSTAYAVNLARDEGLDGLVVIVDPKL